MSPSQDRSQSLTLLYFVLPPFEENGLPFWVSGVLHQCSEVVLWKLLSIQMIFWWISMYRLNKYGDSRQPCHTPVAILNQSAVPYRVLTVASRPAYRFLRRQVRWSGIPVYWRIFHSLSWFTQSKSSQWGRSRCFSRFLLFFLWSKGCWQFDLWFPCFF